MTMLKGYRHRYYLSGLPLRHRHPSPGSVMSIEDEIDLLENREEVLDRKIGRISARIKALKKGKN